MKKDFRGTPISQGQIRKSMKMSLLAGALGMPWFILCTPQQILTVYVRNYLGASSTVLGILVGGINLASLFHLASIYFFQRTKRIKIFWIITTLLQRLLAFMVAWSGWYMYRGGSPFLAVYIILIASVLSASLGNISASGWWSWMAGLIPEKQRATFFGKRSAITQAVNVLFFFGASYILDLFDTRAYLVFTFLYLLAGIGGTVDILLHFFIPEPEMPKVDKDQAKGSFSAPLRDRAFLRFCILLGIFLFSQNIAAPFLAPFTTAEDGVGAPNIWLGIMVVISQGVWVLIVPLWGIIMDRMGRKPVVVLGGLFVFSWLGYLFLTPQNYPVLLPFIALSGGLLAPGFWEGISQMMLNLTREDNRTAYVAWYWTFFGVSAAAGSLVGGFLDDFLRLHPLSLGQLTMEPIHGVIVLSLLLVTFSLTHISRMQTSGEKSLTMVLNTVINPGIFRAVSGMGILNRPATSQKVKKVLRSMDRGASTLAVSEIIERLDDPDQDVREEAARALGRIGTEEAEDALLQELEDKDSSVKISAVRALGEMSSIRAVDKLVQALDQPSEELQQAALMALGNIDSPESSLPLVDQIRRGDKSESIRASAAMAASQRRVVEAADDIFDLMHRASNRVLRRQMSIAVANLMGEPGEFYRYVSGDRQRSEEACNELFEQTKKYLQQTAKSSGLDKKNRKSILQDFREMNQARLDHDAARFLPYLVDLMDQLTRWYIGDKSSLWTGTWILQRISGLKEEQRCPDLDMLLATYVLNSSLRHLLNRQS